MYTHCFQCQRQGEPWEAVAGPPPLETLLLLAQGCGNGLRHHGDPQAGVANHYEASIYMNYCFHPTTSMLSVSISAEIWNCKRSCRALQTLQTQGSLEALVFCSIWVVCVTDVYNSAINFTLPWGRGYLFKHLQHPDSYMHGCWSEPDVMTGHIHILLYLFEVQRADSSNSSKKHQHSAAPDSKRRQSSNSQWTFWELGMRDVWFMW